MVLKLSSHTKRTSDDEILLEHFPAASFFL
jgi:hypothetical protein